MATGNSKRNKAMANRNSTKLNKIYKADCVEFMQKGIDKNSINLIFAVPPYNLSGNSLSLSNNTTGGAFYKVNEQWDTFDYEDYISFSKKWMRCCKDILTNNGSLYISCTQHNIGEILIIGKELGLKLNNILTWYKTNAMPNITKRTFTHSTEFVCWFVKGKNWIFNYEDIKHFNPNKTKDGKDKQMRDFLDFIELPIVQGKERLKDVNNRAAHPTQKPEKLLELIMRASSYEQDIVLDLFFGSGTTGVVAKRLNRNWIGIENDDKYFKLAQQRLYSHD